jgi:hypothetical protein
LGGRHRAFAYLKNNQANDNATRLEDLVSYVEHRVANADESYRESHLYDEDVKKIQNWQKIPSSNGRPREIPCTSAILKEHPLSYHKSCCIEDTLRLQEAYYRLIVMFQEELPKGKVVKWLNRH